MSIIADKKGQIIMFVKDKGITLSEWLERLNQTNSINYQITDIKPCQITIGKSIYNACQYILRNKICYYVIGLLPASYRHSSHVKYMLSDKVYYVAAYYQESNPKYDIQHYDFNFLLFNWDLIDSIDKYERNPYRQMNIKVEYL